VSPLLALLPLALFGAPWQMLVVLMVILLLFGNRLPTLARSLGQSINEFKKGVKEIEDHRDEKP
jgi:sec-independent protein translocase protein TatA